MKISIAKSVVSSIALRSIPAVTKLAAAAREAKALGINTGDVPTDSKIFDDLSKLDVQTGFKLNTKGVKIYPTAEEVVIEINDEYIQKSAELAINLYGNIAGPVLNACKALYPAALSIKQFIADTNTLEAEYNQTPESVEKTEV